MCSYTSAACRRVAASLAAATRARCDRVLLIVEKLHEHVSSASDSETLLSNTPSVQRSASPPRPAPRVSSARPASAPPRPSDRPVRILCSISAAGAGSLAFTYAHTLISPDTFSFGGGAQPGAQTTGLFGANKPAFGATTNTGEVTNARVNQQ